MARTVTSRAEESLRQRRSPDELDRLAFQAIRLALTEGLAAKEVLARMNHPERVVRDEREVQWLISRARQRDLADIKVEPRGGHQSSAAPLDTELGARLSALTGVRDVLAVKTALARDQGYLLDPNAPQRRAAFSESDQLHRLLGQAAAHYLWNRLRQGDRIALGGGRAIGFMVDALDRLAQADPKTFGNIMVESLVGSMIIWPWSERQANLDSDAVAVRLAGVLGVPQQNVSLVHLPIALESGREVIAAVAPHISDAPWEVPPDLAFFGVGVLNSGHNLLQDTGPQSHAIRGEIEELRVKVLPKAPNVIAEICNRYFWIGDDTVPPDLRRAVERILRGLNAKTIAIPLEKLDRAKEKVLVAGGAQKYPGLLRVIQRNSSLGLQLTGLITDEATCRRLLEDLQGRQ
ncbi:MAG: hypothetical protein HY532_01770 [Chloroflexi bacterium]|nr:hypothetical protein [Chloroflexota bacterium]